MEFKCFQIILVLLIFKYRDGSDFAITDQQHTISQTPNGGKVKRCKSRVLYYASHCATQQLVMSGDVESNPGPALQRGLKAPSCSICEKCVKCNQRRFICDTCWETTHAACLNQSNLVLNGRIPKYWTCSDCHFTVLPFSNVRDVCALYSSILSDGGEYEELITIPSNPKHTKICHLNTQSLPSTFDEFSYMLECHKFDIITLSETWLKNNQVLIDYVNIPGYQFEYKNRTDKRGGGVGMYIKDELIYKTRDDITKLDNSIEHVWIEVKGRNKNYSYLVGTFYQPSSIEREKKDWLERFDILLRHITAKWDGIIIITGDFNIDLLQGDKSTIELYQDTLMTYDLKQHITKPTRKSTSLIDHVISNIPEKVVSENVLLCDEISDHDAPHVVMNIKKDKFEKRYKFIRDEKQLNIDEYISDIEKIPFSLIDTFDDPEDQLYVMNELILSCINSHAPLKRCKFTRPPAPWMKDPSIVSSKLKLDELRSELKSCDDREAKHEYVETRNKLKKAIKHSRRTFYQKALSSNRSKEVWKTIRTIIKPQFKQIRQNPDTINDYFNSIAIKLSNTNELNISPTMNDEAVPAMDLFDLRHATQEDVLKHLNSLRSDCSTGGDNIPAKFIKPVAAQLSPVLTKILNNCINANVFPTCWKKSRICPVPKVPGASQLEDFRPISILPVLSKVYEKVILSQLCDFIDRYNIYASTQSGFRKGHSCITILLKLKDDILKAMQRGEVTLSLSADYSKALDTVKYDVLINKLKKLQMSPAFGGSILGPILFNIYVSDLSLNSSCNSIQYADDTNLYIHFKLKEMDIATAKLQSDINQITTWSKINNLMFNSKKTKSIMYSTSQLSCINNLNFSNLFKFDSNGAEIERVSSLKILGITFDEQMTWSTHVNNIIRSSYATISTLKRLKRLAPFHVRKNLAEALILSKIDYGNLVYNNIPQYQMKRLQRVLNVAASFVLQRYASTNDVLVILKWLPVQERVNLSILKLAHKVLYDECSPEYLTLRWYKNGRSLRSDAENKNKLQSDTFRKTFMDCSSALFNDLPGNIRSVVNHKEFIKKVKLFLHDSALCKLLSK
ncbi:uncharacterized protein LOC130648252 [Hydractinia symbiolongicarpus]|uniref:uncharacterized protein LOC130648252 n=1 Tax=Hydractinia symbiolongicarpus TaxID=13093 RepID=UPI00254A415C|nr:uncharacterized protein LOC130648252 [Hydractinia symbiolongicarpus]